MKIKKGKRRLIKIGKFLTIQETAERIIEISTNSSCVLKFNGLRIKRRRRRRNRGKGNKEEEGKRIREILDMMQRTRLGNSSSDSCFATIE